MQASLTNNKKRIESVDVLRGIIMVIMALDHTRDFFHSSANTYNPLTVPSLSPWIFLTRWVTHFCAPTFVFLSGVSIYLQSLRKTKKELSSFIIKRGIWLIIADMIILSFAFTFNPFYNIVFLEVIWAIGISMVILGILIYLPFQAILAIGLIIVLGHNLLDYVEASPGFKPSFLYNLLHSRGALPFAEGHIVLVLYPFLPWAGLMMLGYCTGIFFSTKYNTAERKKLLLITGVISILFFIVLRFTNLYGDPQKWQVQPKWLDTFFSFINVQKYPPSLLFMCATIGPVLILLAFIEKIKNRFTNIVKIYGRTPFFYFVVHFIILHLAATILFFARGHNMADAIKASNNVILLFVLPGEGFGLIITYLLWITIVVVMYPICKKYDRYKTNHPEKKWLSYL